MFDCCSLVVSRETADDNLRKIVDNCNATANPTEKHKEKKIKVEALTRLLECEVACMRRVDAAAALLSSFERQRAAFVIIHVIVSEDCVLVTAMMFALFDKERA